MFHIVVFIVIKVDANRPSLTYEQYGAAPYSYQPQTYHTSVATTSSQQHEKRSESTTKTQTPPSNAMAFIFDKIHQTVHDLGADIKERMGGHGDAEVHSHTHSTECSDGAHGNEQHRFQSFAPQREGNDVKWYVDACGYMWAVSMALERASESIWILDCTFVSM